MSFLYASTIFATFALFRAPWYGSQINIIAREDLKSHQSRVKKMLSAFDKF